MARLAATLETPVVVPAQEMDREIFSAAAVVFKAAGAQLLLAHGTDSAGSGGSEDGVREHEHAD